MTELSPQAEQQLADLSAEDFDALVARVRPPDEPDPKARAAAALRKELGVGARGSKPSKERAAEALRRYASNR